MFYKTFSKIIIILFFAICFFPMKAYSSSGTKTFYVLVTTEASFKSSDRTTTWVNLGPTRTAKLYKSPSTLISTATSSANSGSYATEAFILTASAQPYSNQNPISYYVTFGVNMCTGYSDISDSRYCWYQNTSNDCTATCANYGLSFSPGVCNQPDQDCLAMATIFSGQTACTTCTGWNGQNYYYGDNCYYTNPNPGAGICSGNPSNAICVCNGEPMTYTFPSFGIVLP